MNKSTHGIKQTEHARITQAIREAESKTAGEIFAVVARSSDDYFYVSSYFAAAWSLLLGVALAVVAWLYDQPITALLLAGAQAASLATFLLVFKFFPNLRNWFVPRSIAYRRASSNAVRQFMAHGIHNTEGRSGVLLFVSIVERYAEVVADSGINEKVAQSEWNNMVATLTEHASRDELADGFVSAIEQAGDLLQEYFPPTKGKKSELDDKLVEI